MPLVSILLFTWARRALYNCEDLYKMGLQSSNNYNLLVSNWVISECIEVAIFWLKIKFDKRKFYSSRIILS